MRNASWKPPHLNGGQQVLGGVVHPGGDVTEALRVGGPQHDDFVHAAGPPEVPDVRPDLLHLDEEEGDRTLVIKRPSLKPDFIKTHLLRARQRGGK